MASRWWLYIQAIVWRSLARIGMFLHRTTAPYPPNVSFTRTITFPSAVPHAHGNNPLHIVLHFYCPHSYAQYRKEGRLLPVVVNFHGGGFTLGHATDDCRWAQCVLDVDVVMVSVSYRLAPEYPFPAAVDDGVEALVYLMSHSAELGLDMSRVALSGFSAGGNLAVTVPLRLRSLGLDTSSYCGSSSRPARSTTSSTNPFYGGLNGDVDTHSLNSNINLDPLPPPSTTSTTNLPWPSPSPNANFDFPRSPPSPNLIDLGHSPDHHHRQDHSSLRPPPPSTSSSFYDPHHHHQNYYAHDDRLAILHNSSHQHLPLPLCNDQLRIRAIFCWYPILDFEESRESRRALSIMPSKTLPSVLTTLFDESYLPNRAFRSSPFASPVRASDELLAAAIPQHVFLYICEWDMLLREGQVFVRRLHDLGKHVRSMMIEKVCHAWDKSPNPFRNQNDVLVLYRNACSDMRRIFGE